MNEALQETLHCHDCGQDFGIDTPKWATGMTVENVPEGVVCQSCAEIRIAKWNRDHMPKVGPFAPGFIGWLTRKLMALQEWGDRQAGRKPSQ